MEALTPPEKPAPILTLRMMARLMVLPILVPLLLFVASAYSLGQGSRRQTVGFAIIALLWYLYFSLNLFETVRQRKGETFDEWRTRIVAEASPSKVPLACRLNFHEWYLDSAWFTSVDRCGRCGQHKDPAMGERLEWERSLWEQAPEGKWPSDKINWVRDRLRKGYGNV
jgi:hypothetical protein